MFVRRIGVSFVCRSGIWFIVKASANENPSECFDENTFVKPRAVVCAYEDTWQASGPLVEFRATVFVQRALIQQLSRRVRRDDPPVSQLVIHSASQNSNNRSTVVQRSYDAF